MIVCVFTLVAKAICVRLYAGGIIKVSQTITLSKIWPGKEGRVLFQVGGSAIVVLSFANAYSVASNLCWESEALPSQFALQLYLILSKVGCGRAQGISYGIFRLDICCTVQLSSAN